MLEIYHKVSVNDHNLVTQLVFGLKSMTSWKGSLMLFVWTSQNATVQHIIQLPFPKKD